MRALLLVALIVLAGCTAPDPGPDATQPPDADPGAPMAEPGEGNEPPGRPAEEADGEPATNASAAPMNASAPPREWPYENGEDLCEAHDALAGGFRYEIYPPRGLRQWCFDAEADFAIVGISNSGDLEEKGMVLVGGGEEADCGPIDTTTAGYSYSVDAGRVMPAGRYLLVYNTENLFLEFDVGTVEEQKEYGAINTTPTDWTVSYEAVEAGGSLGSYSASIAPDTSGIVIASYTGFTDLAQVNHQFHLNIQSDQELCEQYTSQEDLGPGSGRYYDMDAIAMGDVRVSAWLDYDAGAPGSGFELEVTVFTPPS